MSRRYNPITQAMKQSTNYSDECLSIMNNIVNHVVSGLDSIQTEIQDRLQSHDTLTDEQLESYILRIANELYFVGMQTEKLGIQEDVCKSIRQECYAKNLLTFTGTVAEKNNLAEKSVQMETLVLSIYSRCYKSVKIRMDAGYETLNSLKKIMNRRISELELSNSRYIGGSLNE